MGGYSRIGVFFFILAGIVAYLKTGSDLFLKVKSGGARLQMASIDRALLGYQLKARRYPNNFVSFMRKNFNDDSGKDASLDPWGFQYKYEATRKGFTLASAGADGKFGTEDDLSWVRDGDKAGMEQGSKFKGSASAKVTSTKVAAGDAESPIMKDFQALFKASAFTKNEPKPMSDAEWLKYLDSYFEQVILE